MLKRTIIGGATLALLLMGQAHAENDGAAYIDIPGFEYGTVHFPHLLHQLVMSDCDVCHYLFPEEPQAIEKTISAGKLRRKQVMTDCKKCHKAREEAGEPSGPIVCKGCHG